MNKYAFTGKTKDYDGTVLHQIVAVRDFWPVRNGDVGGFIASERNLAHSGNAWVSGDASVYDNARVSGNAQVYGDARVSRTPKLLTGFPHIVTITDHHIRAGREQHPPSAWAERGAAIIKADGHSSKEAKAWAEIINRLAEAHNCTDPVAAE